MELTEYTKIKNEIIEALCKAKLNGTEYACVLLIMRKTYGWNKKTDRISLTVFEKNIDCTIQAICKALNKLTVNKIIVAKKNGKTNEYGLNKRINEWVLNNRSVNKTTLNSRLTTTKQSFNKLLNNRLDTKETNKINYTKETVVVKNGGDENSIEFFEKNIGLPSPFILGELVLLNKEHGEENVIKAIKIAVNANVLNIRYIKGILDNEKAKGYLWEKAKQQKKNPLFKELTEEQKRNVNIMIKNFQENLGQYPKDENIKIMINKVKNGENI